MDWCTCQARLTSDFVSFAKPSFQFSKTRAREQPIAQKFCVPCGQRAFSAARIKLSYGCDLAADSDCAQSYVFSAATVFVVRDTQRRWLLHRRDRSAVRDIWEHPTSRCYAPIASIRSATMLKSSELQSRPRQHHIQQRSVRAAHRYSSACTCGGEPRLNSSNTTRDSGNCPKISDEFSPADV